MRVCPLGAGSWTTWSTTWSWRNRTARAGTATRLAIIATENIWLRSNCSATLRAPTAPSSRQVWPELALGSKNALFSKHQTCDRFLLFQPLVRSVNLPLHLSKFFWSTWRNPTNLGRCRMCARSEFPLTHGFTPFLLCLLCLIFHWFIDSPVNPPLTKSLFYSLHRSAITDPPSSQMWRLTSGLPTKTQKSCSVLSAWRFWKVVTCICSITWNTRCVAVTVPFSTIVVTFEWLIFAITPFCVFNNLILQRKGIHRCGKCRLNFLSFKEKVEHRTQVHRTFKKPKALEGLLPGTKVWDFPSEPVNLCVSILSEATEMDKIASVLPGDHSSFAVRKVASAVRLSETVRHHRETRVSQ